MNAPAPLFIATRRFDPADGKKWHDYFEWAKIPGLVEIVGLDCILCPRLIRELLEEDWNHIVNADFRLDYFYHLEYLKQRVQNVARKNILGLYRNPESHLTAAPGPGNFAFVGYELIEEPTQISALTNCGGFPDVFANDELNRYGLIESFERASTIRNSLPERHPEEPHAQCELYAVWRLAEAQ